MYKFKTFTSLRVNDVDVDKKLNLWVENHPNVVIVDVKYSCTEYHQSILIMYNEVENDVLGDDSFYEYSL